MSYPTFSFKKYFLLTAGLFISVFLVLIFIWHWSPLLRSARQLEQGMNNFHQVLEAEKEKYAKDTYGGQSPEETYQLFLSALQKQDIDLASKYFILEKQEEYKQLLNQIKKSGQWEEMMADLLALRNQKGKMKGDEYIIEIISPENVSVSTIVIKKPVLKLGSEQQELSPLWKISQF